MRKAAGAVVFGKTNVSLADFQSYNPVYGTNNNPWVLRRTPGGSAAALGDDDLPIGVQIIGPEFSNLITIGLAKLLDGAGFAFTPPPGYR